MEIREEVPSGQSVHVIDHSAQLVVVVVVHVRCFRDVLPVRIGVDEIGIKCDGLRGNKCKGDDDDGVVDDEGQYLFIGRKECYEGSPGFLVVNQNKSCILKGNTDSQDAKWSNRPPSMGRQHDEDKQIDQHKKNDSCFEVGQFYVLAFYGQSVEGLAV